MEKAIKESFTVPGSPSGGLSERGVLGLGWGGIGVSSALRGRYIYQTSWSGGVKRPPGVTSAVSVCFWVKSKDIEEIGGEDGGGGVLFCGSW